MNEITQHDIEAITRVWAMFASRVHIGHVKMSIAGDVVHGMPPNIEFTVICKLGEQFYTETVSVSLYELRRNGEAENIINELAAKVRHGIDRKMTPKQKS